MFTVTSKTLEKVQESETCGRMACRSTNMMTRPATMSAIEGIPIDQATRRAVDAFIDSLLGPILRFRG